MEIGAMLHFLGGIDRETIAADKHVGTMTKTDVIPILKMVQKMLTKSELHFAHILISVSQVDWKLQFSFQPMGCFCSVHNILL